MIERSIGFLNFNWRSEYENVSPRVGRHPAGFCFARLHSTQCPRRLYPAAAGPDAVAPVNVFNCSLVSDTILKAELP